MVRTKAEKILDTYTLEEIFEINDLTEVDVLEILIRYKFVVLPSYQPVDL